MIKAGKSFLDAGAILCPELSIDGQLLAPGSNSPLLPKNNARTLRLERIEFEGDATSESFFRHCNLEEDSKFRIVIDIECSEFEMRATLFRGSFDPSHLNELSDRDLAPIPPQIIRAGCEIRLVIVVTTPKPSSKLGCDQPGGVLFSWKATFPPSHRGTMFPVRQERVEGLWTVDLHVNDINDLSKPIRSAVCLKVDGRRFSNLLGERADVSVIRQTSNWLMIETYANLVMHVLANDDLVAYFDDKDPRKLGKRGGSGTPSAKTEKRRIADYLRKLDDRSVESLLFRLLSFADSPPSSLREDFLADPIEVQAKLRESFGRQFREGGV
jgi:hypothetical protein